MDMPFNFIRFYSPGGVTERPISSWDVEEALKSAQRFAPGDTPFAFRFESVEDFDDESTHKVGPRHFLNGRVLTIDEMRTSTDPKAAAVLRIMETERADRVFQDKESGEFLTMGDQDIFLDVDPRSINSLKM